MIALWARASCLTNFHAELLCWVVQRCPSSACNPILLVTLKLFALFAHVTRELEVLNASQVLLRIAPVAPDG